MKTNIYSAAAILTTLLTASAAHAQAVWGSFDDTRINYSAGTLNGSANATLRGIITGNGGTIAAGTPTLTAAYLGGVDVFYTSLLSTVTGVLSGAEQTDLQNWVAAGGTLVVTADIFPLPAYESFTSVYGVTNYAAVNGGGTANVVAAHALTSGVVTIDYATNSDYSFGGDALLLANDGSGSDYMIVMEPATGFNVGGRMVVFGDHNMFTEGSINSNDNTQLATNLANWAAVPEPGTFLVIGAGILCLAIHRRR